MADRAGSRENRLDVFAVAHSGESALCFQPVEGEKGRGFALAIETLDAHDRTRRRAPDTTTLDGRLVAHIGVGLHHPIDGLAVAQAGHCIR